MLIVKSVNYDIKKSLTRKQINHIHYAKFAVQNVEAKPIKNEDNENSTDRKKKYLK